MMQSKILILIIVIGATLFMTGCIKPIPYTAAQLAAFDSRVENMRLVFKTEEGRQVAFYLPPLNSPENSPGKINILYPGINSVALGWIGFIRQSQDPDAAYLLIDYPSRGLCEGDLLPETTYLNTEGALKVLAEKFDQEKLDAKLSLLGHSFGSGAALQFAQRTKEVERIVLVAPYNTLKGAVAETSWFLSLILPAQIDNVAIIRELLSSEHRPGISIFHGTQDQTLPVTMGRELAAIDPDRIDYYEFVSEGHSSLLTTHREMLFAFLNGRGYVSGEKVVALPEKGHR
jgi:hypothetical protein